MKQFYNTQMKAGTISSADILDDIDDRLDNLEQETHNLLVRANKLADKVGNNSQWIADTMEIEDRELQETQPQEQPETMTLLENVTTTPDEVIEMLHTLEVNTRHGQRMNSTEYTVLRRMLNDLDRLLVRS